jgi:hypothetical protein
LKRCGFKYKVTDALDPSSCLIHTENTPSPARDTSQLNTKQQHLISFKTESTNTQFRNTKNKKSLTLFTKLPQKITTEQ